MVQQFKIDKHPRYIQERLQWNEFWRKALPNQTVPPKYRTTGTDPDREAAVAVFYLPETLPLMDVIPGYSRWPGLIAETMGIQNANWVFLSTHSAEKAIEGFQTEGVVCVAWSTGAEADWLEPPTDKPSPAYDALVYGRLSAVLDDWAKPGYVGMTPVFPTAEDLYIEIECRGELTMADVNDRRGEIAAALGVEDVVITGRFDDGHEKNASDAYDFSDFVVGELSWSPPTEGEGTVGNASR